MLAARRIAFSGRSSSARLDLQLYLEVMDRETLETGTMSERASRQYLAWSNSLRLTLRELGIKESAAVVPPSLGDYLASKRAAE